MIGAMQTMSKYASAVSKQFLVALSKHKYNKITTKPANRLENETVR